jgi:hypothetical protein
LRKWAGSFSKARICKLLRSPGIDSGLRIQEPRGDRAKKTGLNYGNKDRLPKGTETGRENWCMLTVFVGCERRTERGYVTVALLANFAQSHSEELKKRKASLKCILRI